MSEKANNTAHWVLGVALLLIGVFIIAAIVLVQSQAATSEVDISNSVPTLESITFNDSSYGGIGGSGDYTLGQNQTGISLTAGGSKTYHVNGIIEDLNGRDEITSVNLNLFRNGQTCTGAGDADNNYCYNVTGCSLRNEGGGDLNQKEFNCEVALQYWADSTSAGGVDAPGYWVAAIEMEDPAGTVADSTTQLEVQTVFAANIPSAIDFGALGLGDSTGSGTNVDQTITQNGNDVIDIDVSGTALSCDGVGSIPVGNVEWNTNDNGHSGAGATDLTGSGVGTSLSLGYRTDEVTPVTDILHWDIAIPSTGVAGTCTGTITQTVVQI